MYLIFISVPLLLDPLRSVFLKLIDQTRTIPGWTHSRFNGNLLDNGNAHAKARAHAKAPVLIHAQVRAHAHDNEIISLETLSCSFIFN